MLQLWNDASTLDKDSLVKILVELSLPGGSEAVLDLGVVAVPVASLRQDEGDLLHVQLAQLGCGLGDLWCDKDAIAEHELRCNLVEVWKVWVFVPHDAPEGDTCLRGLPECGVDVVDQVVTAVDGVTDGGLDTLGLKPWLTVWIVNVSVSSEEWIIHTQLVEHHPEILSWLTVESWHI